MKYCTCYDNISFRASSNSILINICEILSENEKRSVVAPCLSLHHEITADQAVMSQPIFIPTQKAPLLHALNNRTPTKVGCIHHMHSSKINIKCSMNFSIDE